MTEIKILHLSDIHFKKKRDNGDETFYNDVQQKLIQSVKSHAKEQGNPDVVAVTGDIAFSGKGKEYKKALTFFDQLKNIFPEETEYLAVPGNHDVDREALNEFFSLQNIIKEGKTDKFLENKKGVKDSINPKFTAFQNFCHRLNPSLYQSGENYFWVKNFPRKDATFLGLNSVWASEGLQDRFNIALGYPQVMAALKKSECPNKVVLMHHPPINWLKDMESGKTRVELFKNCRLLLHGHNHSDNALVFIDPSDSIICLGANASYTGDKDGFIGFQFITAHFFEERTAVKVTVWPYIFDKRRNDFVSDRERWKAQEGKSFFVIQTGVFPTNITETPRSSPYLQVPVKYRNWVQQFYSRIDIEKLDPREKIFPVSLPGVYIPIETANPFFVQEKEERREREISNKRKMAGPGKELGQKEPPFIDIEKLVARKKCILLRGQAGMGKTTLIKHLAYTVTQGQGPLILKDCLPVVVVLKKIWPIFQADIISKKTDITFESLLRKYFEIGVNGTISLEEVDNFLCHDRALFLLDGWDEVPEDLRRRLAELVAAFRAKYIKNYFLLTGRPHGIDAGVNEYFGEFLHDIEYLDKKKVEGFISRWVQGALGKKDGFTGVNVEEMISNIQLHEHAGIFTQNPLLLTALCVFYLESGKRIPDQRVELYERIVSNLLYRRFHDPAEPGKDHLISDYLNHLGFLMQEQNIKIIEVGKAKELLKEYFRKDEESLSLYNRRINNLFTEIESRCGLLERPGEGEVEFFHQTFQEFMAAQHMLYTDKDYKESLGKSWWHETLLFYTGLLNRERKDQAKRIALELLNRSPEDTGWTGRMWLLGAKVLRDIREYQRDTEVVSLAGKRLNTIIESDASLDERFEAGEILGLLGDPRIKSTPMAVVKAGDFSMGATNYKWEKPEHTIYLDEFMIGKYPVTNEEFDVFIREGGYHNEEFWTAEGWEWKETKKISEPIFRHDRKWNGPNFPVVGVSWYEACAYAKWLSRKKGNLYTLPTEAQWEKAARGLHGSPFPWGKEFDKNLCNTYECGLNRTNPVGIFTKGKSPYECFDLSGNVWEWCLDWYDKNYYQLSPAENPPGPSTGEFRVIRGGSWYNGAWRCHGAFRDYEEPGERLYCLGFRLVKLAKKPVEKKIVQQETKPAVKKILILAANPKTTPRLRLDEEVREIEEILRQAKYRNQFEFCTIWAVRPRDIRKALLDVEPHIVHFIGHGDEKGLLVEDEIGFAVNISTEALVGLFALFSDKVECVILSACNSSIQANAIKKHIKYVIGMEGLIDDKAAIEFALGFYDALSAGRTIDDAFEFGRNAILTKFPNQSKHLIPVLDI